MNKISIYTDGSSRGNPGPGGWGAIIIIESQVASRKSQVTEIGGRDEKTTNNRMEMMAAVRALEMIERTEQGEVEVEIHTDSSYLLNGITKWVKGWQKNGWVTKTKEEVMNKDLWIELLSVVNGKNILWKKVSGHSGHSYNDRCDTIATSFADNQKINLYNGLLSDYKIDEKRGGGINKSRALAFSYVSEINGVVLVHKTWEECKKRVEGKKARFRKSISEEDEKEIIKSFQKK